MRRPTWARNTSGLQASARQRAAATRARVDEALAALRREPTKRTNFNAVATMAGVTKAYLYKDPELRHRIDTLRREWAELPRGLAPDAGRSEASTRVLLLAKERRIRELEAEVERLKRELAECRGQLYERL